MLSGKAFKINTLKELEQLAIELYILAAIWALLVLLIAFVMANGVKYEGGANPRDHIKRRRIFYIIGALPPSIVLLFNIFFVRQLYIKAAVALFAAFSSINLTAIAIAFTTYFVFGLSTSFIAEGKKWGTIVRKKMV